MRIFRNALLTAAAAMVLAAAAAIPFVPRMALAAFASAHNLDVKYKKLRKATINAMAFDGLTVVDRAKGIGLASKDAAISFVWNGPDPRNATVGFDLREVRFVRRERNAASKYDTLDGLLALPLSTDWVYREISGKVRSSKEAVTIRDFMAKSDQMRLSFNGSIYRDNTIDSDIVVYFADDLTRNIPAELKNLALSQEEPGWKSLSVKLAGNYAMPTIQLSSKLFRLSIGLKKDPSL